MAKREPGISGEQARRISKLQRAICAAIVDLEASQGDAWETICQELTEAVGRETFETYRKKNL